MTKCKCSFIVEPMDYDNYIVLANVFTALHADTETDDETKRRLALKFCIKVNNIEDFSFSEKDLDIHLKDGVLIDLGLAIKCHACNDVKYLFGDK